MYAAAAQVNGGLCTPSFCGDGAGGRGGGGVTATGDASCKNWRATARLGEMGAGGGGISDEHPSGVWFVAAASTWAASRAS